YGVDLGNSCCSLIGPQRTSEEAPHGAPQPLVIFKCPSDHKKDFVKRLIALPGEWIRIPVSQEIIKVPAGHCWVEGDNAARSWDSRSFGPIPLGLIKGRVTHIIWPPSKMGRVERKWPEGRVSPF
ncbi:mitochondrial inner membrane protease subunit 2-like, partial [Lolium rigidum]|uniref:mitochondrial inner membrane protease subunit 2-like n=1 Tax=Lolium rigidum TaxID=89674 RepID=UPI001F5D49A3